MSSPRRLLKRFNEIGHARYLTCSCYRRLPLLSNPLIRDAFVDQLHRVHQRNDFMLLAWVVMPEHFHLLVLPRQGHVTEILRELKAPFAQRMIKRWHELEAPILSRIRDARGTIRFWQHGGGYDRNIISDHEMSEKITYVHANPVRRGLVDSPCEWIWSSARAYAGLDHIGPPVVNGLI